MISVHYVVYLGTLFVTVFDKVSDMRKSLGLGKKPCLHLCTGLLKDNFLVLCLAALAMFSSKEVVHSGPMLT